MNGSIQVPSGPTRPINILWLDTIYLDFPCDIFKLPQGHSAESGPHEIASLQEDFFLSVKKLSDDVTNGSIQVTLMRQATRGQLRDYGCSLQFKFLVSPSKIENEARCVELLPSRNMVSVYYCMSIFYSPFARKEMDKCRIKVIIKMMEFAYVESRTRDYYEDYLAQNLLKFGKDKGNLEALAYLLKRPSISGIFTGRENSRIAGMKLAWITRTLNYAKEIVDHFEAVRNRIPNSPKPNLRLILDVILKEKYEPISNKDLIELYLRSHESGVQYLQVLSSVCIIDNLNDFDLAFDAMSVAAKVDDKILYDAAMDALGVILSSESIEKE